MDWRFLVAAARAGPLPGLLALAAAGLLATALLGERVDLPGLCGSIGVEAVAGGTWLTMRLLPLETLAFGWLLMLWAMMPPLIGQPVAHISCATLPSRRLQSLLMFAFGYVAVWMAAGLVLVPIAIATRVAAAGSAAAVPIVALALLWSASPAAQAARNSCHRLHRIAASGLDADRDCLRQGVATGMACCAACWPWMLVPFGFAGAHVAAMAAVAAILFLERLSPPGRPAWQCPPAVAVLRALRRPQNVLGRL